MDRTKKMPSSVVMTPTKAGRHSSLAADVHPQFTSKKRKAQGGARPIAAPACSLLLKMARDAVDRGDFGSAQVCLDTAQDILGKLKGV